MRSTALRAFALALVAAACTAPVASPPTTADPARSFETTDPGQAEQSAIPSPVASLASPVGSPTTTPSAAERAPDFTLATLDGPTYSLEDQRGHPVWVAFWAPGCVSCEPTLLAMDELYPRHASAGLSVVAVAVATDQETAEAYAAALALSYPVALDSDGAVFVRYRAFFLPAHCWIDGDGVIRDWAEGEVGCDLLAEAVAKVLATD